MPELPRIPGLVLAGSTFSDCLMVVQFLRNFGKVLGFDVNTEVPSLSILQEGLLNIGDSMGEVQDLLVKLVSAAVCDPGLVTGYKVKKKKNLKIKKKKSIVKKKKTILMNAFCIVYKRVQLERAFFYLSCAINISIISILKNLQGEDILIRY